jgi:hypothetical protein
LRITIPCAKIRPAQSRIRVFVKDFALPRVSAPQPSRFVRGV